MADPPVPGQRPFPPREAGAGLAGAPGVPHQAALGSRLLPPTSTGSSGNYALDGPSGTGHHQIRINS
jgi:hypothetical protein